MTELTPETIEALRSLIDFLPKNISNENLALILGNITYNYEVPPEEAAFIAGVGTTMVQDLAENKEPLH